MPDAFKLKHFADSEYLDHPSHAEIGIIPYPDKLHVVTMLSNPLRWRNRYKNYWKFERHVEDSGANLYTTEVAFGGRPFEITEPNNPRHLQLRTSDELWHKENALNLMIQRLPLEAKYVAWVDADITFQRSDWAQETLQLLQHYDFLQMFSEAHNIDVNHTIKSSQTGFMYQYMTDMVTPAIDNLTAGKTITSIYPSDYSYSGYSGPYSKGAWHPGFAWAAKRSALNKVGMLIDYAILGAADAHMAWALIGQVQNHLQKGLSSNYLNWVMEWQARAEQHIQRNVSYMPGAVFHSYHGSLEKRYYHDRWKFLLNAKFNPVTDIKKDWQGLWQLSGNNPTLRDGIRQYYRMRHEDEN